MTQPRRDELSRCRERIQRLEAIVETSFLVNSTLDLKQLAQHIIDIATRMVGAERGSLFLVDRQRGTLRSLVAQGLSSRELSLGVGEGIVGAVAASGEALILDEPYDDPRFDPSIDRATGFTTRSLLTVPIRDRTGVLTAVLQLLNRRDGDFSAADVDFLAELGVPFAIALTTAHLHQQILARERMREELRLAAEIQRTLRPRADSLPPGLELETVLEPCLEVGGDYLDLIPSPDGERWWLVVADISGKGVAAGLIAANVQAYMWSRRKDRAHLEDVVRDANELLYGLAHGRKFATMVVVEWRPASASLRWVSAGHPPIFIHHRGALAAFPATGRPIGLLPDQSYGSGELSLAAGDYLVLYTDGVIEAGLGASAGEFGIERLGRLVDGGGEPAAVLSRIRAALRRHLGDAEADDDVTILCARRVADTSVA